VLRNLFAALAALIVFAAVPVAAQTADPANTLVMETSKGRVVIAMRPDLAPKHVEQIKALVAEKFYDGIVFHRVIDGFMAQTGDPTGTGMGGSKLPDIPAEFSAENFGRGVVGMARAQDPDSANSQFFIMFADGGFLNGQYTVWGQVVEGMEIVDQINKGEPPASPDKIITLRLASDAG
jgi:peptidylprolyl isomerase